MSATEQSQLAPIPATIDNVADWQQIAARITSAAGAPPVVSTDMIAGLLGTAVPLLFAADATGDDGLLRGTFTDLVIAQRQSNAGDLEGERPTSVRIHLVGPHMAGSLPVLRTHLEIQVRRADGDAGVNRQFWDLQFGGQVTVSQPICPNCGGPIGAGQLICGHCGTDVRSVAEVPLVVSRLDLY